MMPHLTKKSTSSSGSEIHNHDSSSVDRSQPPNPARLSSNSNLEAPPLSPAVSGFNFDSGQVSPRVSGFDSRSGSFAKAPDWDDGTPQSAKSAKSSVKSAKDQRKKSVAKEHQERRKTFFEDQFSYKEGWETHLVEKARHESPVVAELRTNVIIKDEYSLVTDLSAHVAQRYQRPESAVMITITHSACLMYGGTFEPAYILNICAVEAHTQAATNKRNTGLMQGFLAEILGVTPDRGIVRFQPIKDDCLGTMGRTLTQDIGRRQSEVSGGLKSVLTNSRRKSMNVPSMKRRNTEFIPLPDTEDKTGKKDKRKSMIAEKRKSFLSLSGSKSSGDQKKQTKQRRMSLHPPNMKNLSEQSSPSTTPEMPSLVFSNSNGAHLNPAKVNGHQGSRSPLNSARTQKDPTRSLLQAASQQLSTMSLPTVQANAPPLDPQISTSAQGGLGITTSPHSTKHSRPSSRKSLASRSLSPAQVESSGLLAPPPPIPMDRPHSSQLSKRKSILSIFRRDTKIT